MKKIRIWDLPTRLFHWALALCVLGSFISVNVGGLYMQWHAYFGIAILGLILFRLIWGFVGTHYAKFSQFIKGPKAIKAYLQNPKNEAGHSPIAGLSVVVVLVFFGFQAILGLFTTDEIAFDGPLAKYISNEWVDIFSHLHQFNQFILIGIVVLHVGAIIFYKYIKRINLTQAMLTGDKDSQDMSVDEPISAKDDGNHQIKALVIFLMIASVFYYIFILRLGT